MFYLKIHEINGQKLIAICDKEILGKVIPHNGVKLKIREAFYGNIEYDADEVLQELKSFSQLNVFGERIAKLMIEEKIVHPDVFLWIEFHGKKIGHAMIM
ncbi:MAG: DUF424 family protein [Methanobacteriota archaeon]|nr:MAG: DUF424 family protein [Euryarchaeota archaeon]